MEETQVQLAPEFLVIRLVARPALLPGKPGNLQDRPGRLERFQEGKLGKMLKSEIVIRNTLAETQGVNFRLARNEIERLRKQASSQDMTLTDLIKNRLLGTSDLDAENLALRNELSWLKEEYKTIANRSPPRVKRVSVTLSIQEYQELTARAKEKQTSKAALIRGAIFPRPQLQQDQDLPQLPRRS